jgi:hypothetical protein
MMSAFLDQWFELQPGTDQFARVGAAGAPPQGITPRCAGRAAIHLCLTTPVVISMTATQRSVFLRLCILQQEEAASPGGMRAWPASSSNRSKSPPPRSGSPGACRILPMGNQETGP